MADTPTTPAPEATPPAAPIVTVTPSSGIHPKVQAAGIAGIAGTVILYLLGIVGVDTSQTLSNLIVTVVAVLAGYLKSA